MIYKPHCKIVMKKTPFLVASLVALSLTVLVRADDYFSPPSLEQTLVCNNPSVVNYPDANNYCKSVLQPYVCGYLNTYGMQGVPNYMALWMPSCSIYKVGSPPPG